MKDVNQKREPTGVDRGVLNWRQGQQKGGDWMGEEAEETGLRRRTAGADRDLGSRLRAAIQRLQDGQ